MKTKNKKNRPDITNLVKKLPDNYVKFLASIPSMIKRYPELKKRLDSV